MPRRPPPVTAEAARVPFSTPARTWAGVSTAHTRVVPAPLTCPDDDVVRPAPPRRRP